MPDPRRTAPGFLLFALLWVGCGAPSTDPPSRVLVVALESPSSRVVDRLVAAGEMPNLARLLSEGARADLRAPDPLDPSMLWATAFTGKAPSEHRMHGELVTLPSGARSLPPSSMRQAKTFLQVASDAGRTVVGVGLPTTWPAEVHNGALVTSPVLPTRWTETTEHTYEIDRTSMTVHPPALLERVEGLLRPLEALPREEFSRMMRMTELEYRMLYDDPLGSIYAKENPLRDLGLTWQRDASFVAVARALTADLGPDLVAVHLELLEPIQRVYWPFSDREGFPDVPAEGLRRYGDAVDAAYRRVDELLGELMADLPEDAAVAVFGQRGFDTVTADDDPSVDGVEGRPVNSTFLVLWGQGVAPGVRIERASLADVTPTLLRWMDIHVGSDMSGRVLDAAFDPAFLQAHPRRTVESHDEEWDQSTRYAAPPANPGDSE